MKTNHTQGPWIIAEREDQVIFIDAPISSTGYDESMEICQVSWQDSDSQEANARLIAAAPEMLQALIKADQRITQLCMMIAVLSHDPKKARVDDYAEEIRQAIQKAKGE